MAGIVGVHGIAQQFRGGYQLGTVWFDSIRDGLAAAGYGVIADELAPSDLRVAFFGNLFRPPGTMAAADPPFTAADVRPGLERDLLTAFFSAVVAQDPGLASPAGAMGAGMASVQVMLERLMRSRTFAGMAQRAFIGNLRQVTAFLTDPVVAENVLQRVDAEIGTDTKVLVGHSLGSVVAYEYLCRFPRPSVELLVTLGSPLGIRTLVFDKLIPEPVAGAGAWPSAVAAWLNVADPDDVVALRKDLAPLFPGLVPGQSILDRQVNNGDQSHAVDRYLNAPQTGSAIGGVFG